MTCGSVGLFAISTIMTFAQVVSPLGLLASVIFLLTAIISAKKIENMENVQANYTVIQTQIQYLKELKRQKNVELKHLQNPQFIITKKTPETKAILVDKLNYSDLDILKQCLQVLQEINKDASMLDVAVAKQAFEEIAKQKTIHK